MNAKEKIIRALGTLRSPDKLTNINIFRGWCKNNWIKGTGWWVTKQPIYLGRTVKEALAIIEMWREEEEENVIS